MRLCVPVWNQVQHVCIGEALKLVGSRGSQG